MGSTTSLVDYYQSRDFNPVPIDVRDRAIWQDHFAKRSNLYQRQLGIPLRLMRGCRVLEFGCNSGENSLVLAAHGAELTLVEPNHQVLPRLGELFNEFGLSERIVQLENDTMDGFALEAGTYDLVIAEGFLSSLANRDAMLRKMCAALGRGGIGVMSFNDRYGLLLEQTRRAYLYRACELAGIDDPGQQESLALSRRLFEGDYSRLNASRPLEVWWEDQLVNPFLDPEWLWSYEAVFPVLKDEGCEFYATSPGWSDVDDRRWYKDICDPAERWRQLDHSWRRSLPFMLTGLRNSPEQVTPADVLEAVAHLVDSISRYAARQLPVTELVFPIPLKGYLSSSDDASIRQFGLELERVFLGLEARSVDELITTWLGSGRLRDLWGTPYHYLGFIRNPS